ncbi:MAG: TIGR03905 family TSCPD domain-containing protein [Clostridia bacterium]|nr:TIGR03905 family TSCPD domain-containing protein [Clostridia bacterium]
MTYTYTTKGVCARSITIEVEDNIVKEVKFLGGCNGNTSGISKLVVGMEIDEVISRLENIRCGFKTTSCPDQLAKALKEIKEKE